MLHFQQHRFRMFFFFFFAQMRSYSGHYDVIYYPFLVVCEGLLTAPQNATNTDGLNYMTLLVAQCSDNCFMYMTFSVFTSKLSECEKNVGEIFPRS